jgi:polyribonucleotide nucleotidyltransferase
VKTIVQFGAFVEILPNKDGLLHISEIDWKKVAKVEDVLKEGQEVEVKIIDIEPKTGKIKLSRKELLPRPPRQEPEHRSPQPTQN